MNRQRISNTMVLGIAGVSLLLLGAFPQTLWASHGDRKVIGSIGDVSLMFTSHLRGKHHPPPKRHHSRVQNRHRRPAVHTIQRPLLTGAINVLGTIGHRSDTVIRDLCLLQVTATHINRLRSSQVEQLKIV